MDCLTVFLSLIALALYLAKLFVRENVNQKINENINEYISLDTVYILNQW